MSALSTVLARVAIVLSLLGPVEQLDWQVQHAVQSTRSPGWDRVMNGATSAGQGTVLFGALLAVAVFTGPLGPATARTVLVALVPTNLAVEGLKRLTFRARPDGEHRRSNASFPSSHAANAFAVAAVLSGRWRRLAPAWFVAAAVIAWSRVYLNRHFLSDVVCAAIIGLACGIWATRWARSRAGAVVESGAIPERPGVA
jgi:membrane-associated phospholipid phosphatase